MNQAATELFRRRRKHALTGANQRSFVIDLSSRSLPSKTSLPPYFLANLSPNSTHLFTAITPPRVRISVQYILKRTTRAALPTSQTLRTYHSFCHLLPGQNLVSHHPWKVIAAAGVVRDKPYGFSDLRAAVKLQIG